MTSVIVERFFIIARTESYEENVTWLCDTQILNNFSLGVPKVILINGKVLTSPHCIGNIESPNQFLEGVHAFDYENIGFQNVFIRLRLEGW